MLQIVKIVLPPLDLVISPAAEGSVNICVQQNGQVFQGTLNLSGIFE